MGVDADKSTSTGAATAFAGYDYQFILYQGQAFVFAWDGSRFPQVSRPSLAATVSGATQQLTINRADLGNTSGFLFDANTVSYDGNQARSWDRIPDSGLATYDLSFPVHLTVTKAGAGTGTVSAGTVLNCGSTCSAVFQQGQSATLAATPDPDSVFAGWSGGGCSGLAATCTLTIAADTAVTATFVKKRVPLSAPGRKFGRA